MTTNPLSSLYSDIEQILKSCIIKYSYNAELYETLETRKYSDEYLDALDEKDTFFVYFDYTEEEYLKAIDSIHPGFVITDETYNQIYKWQADPNTVTEEMQQALLKIRRNKVVSNYEEPNNYYRMLNGLPPIEELTDDDTNNPNFFYINDKLIKKYKLEELHLENYGIDPTLPIHKIQDTLGNRYITILESLGIFDFLRADYPDKTYLNFLGSKRIDIKEARTAKNFQILRITNEARAITTDAFCDIYERCRTYYMNVIFIPGHRESFAYYDNFIALCIMSMTIQQIFARTITYAIDREFFDDYMVQLLYSVYGLPYESHLPYETQRRIVKNLNVLIQNKATNQVIYDVSHLLGFHKISINKYYLVKERKFDSKGNLIYQMKDVYDDDGNVIGEDYDLGKMYDVYFQKVALNSENIYKAITDKSNYVDYESLTMDDPMWWEDENLWSEIYEREFNFAETKYLGITISYKLSELVFENIIMLRMVFDMKDSIEEIQIELPKITGTTTVSLFDAVVFMCAMICKKYGIKGEILTDISKILHVIDHNNELQGEVRGDTLGFNFRAVSSEIINPAKCVYTSCPFYDKEHVDEEGNPYPCTLENTPCASISHLQKNLSEIQRFLTEEEKEELNSYLDDLVISGKTMEEQISCFNNLYKDIKGLYNFIANKLSYSSDLNEYMAFRNLYRALYIVKEENVMFKKGFTEDSPVAKTYLDYLEAMNPLLANYVNESNEVDLYVAIDHIISQMEMVLGQLDSLYLVNDGTSVLQEYLLKLIRFFKSYTTELVGLGIVYVFDFKPDNMLRLIDKVGKIHKVDEINDKSFHLVYADQAHLTSTITHTEKTMKLHDSIFYHFSE